MAISIPLLAKGAAGLAAIGAPMATAIYYQNEIKDFFQTNEQTTKFDKALIDFLNDGGKIAFKTKKGNEELPTDFPNFSGSDTTATVSITVGIKTNPSDSDGYKLIEKTDGDSNDKGKLSSLRRVNNNKDWTWECEIKFERKSGSAATELKDKKLLINNEASGKGFFNKLKEESNEGKIKDKLIKACAKERGEEINKLLNNQTDLSSWASAASGKSSTPENDKIKSKISFSFEDDNGSTGSDKKLIIQESQKEEFKNLFGSSTNN